MKNIAFIAGIVLIAIIAGAILIMNRPATITGNVTYDGEAQQVTLSMQSLNYYPETIKVKAGQPVEITLDESVTGCLRAFTIRELGVYTVSRKPADTIKFTPTEAGTYQFACSMGMAFGTIIVE